MYPFGQSKASAVLALLLLKMIVRTIITSKFVSMDKHQVDFMIRFIIPVTVTAYSMVSLIGTNVKLSLLSQCFRVMGLSSGLSYPRS